MVKKNGEIMRKYFFLKALLPCAIFFIFSTIFQHNKVIKINYEKRRNELKLGQLKKEYNRLMVYHTTMCDFQITQSIAQHRCGMKLVSLAQIETLTDGGGFDFYTASSSDAMFLINQRSA
jgi:cell division protein FtsL